MSRHAARMADRLAETQDKAIDVIDEALDKFQSDMDATEKKRIGGEWVEVPIMRLMPKDIAILLDRLEVLFDPPAHIYEGRDLTVSSELPLDALNRMVELTRGGVSVLALSPRPFEHGGGQGHPDGGVTAPMITTAVRLNTAAGKAQHRACHDTIALAVSLALPRS